MKLPNWMCRVIGHKDYPLSYEDWKAFGVVTVCRRCGKGYKGEWVDGTLDQLRQHYGANFLKGGGFRDLIKHKLHLYDIEELQAGGWCGCCGKWLADEVVPKDWPWSLCPDWEIAHK